MMKKILFVMMAVAFSFPAFAECKTDKGCDLKTANHSAKSDCDEDGVPENMPRCCGKNLCPMTLLKMDKELGLTADQKAKLTQIGKNTEAKNAVLKQKMASKKEAMMAEASKKAPNSRNIEKLIRSKHNLMAQMQINKFRAHTDSTKVLTPEQVAKLAPKGGKKVKDCKTCK